MPDLEQIRDHRVHRAEAEMMGIRELLDPLDLLVVAAECLREGEEAEVDDSRREVDVLEQLGFAREAQALGVSYFGVCCGAAPHHIRSVAEALGRTPPASAYSADMSKHAFLGTNEQLKSENLAYAEKL